MNAAQRLARDPNLNAIMSDAEAAWGTASPQQALSRRTFLKLTGLAGGGLALAFYVGNQPIASGGARGSDFAPNAFLRISSDGTVLIYSKSPEIGQGIKTAFPMIVAEELDVNWADVLVEQAAIDTDVYGRQRAGGSRSIPTAWDQLREAGAAARLMLLSAAAAKWGVSEAECSTAASVVTHKPTGRQLGYGALAEASSLLPVPDTADLKLKSRNDYRLIGTRVGGVDNKNIVTGQPLFGIDQAMAGMVYASYSKCPATGGRVRNANLDEIRTLPGIRDAFVLQGNDIVTELMPGIAIIGDSTWAVQAARAHLRIDWDESDASTDSWSELTEQAEQLAGKPGGETEREYGDVHHAFANADKTLEAFYSYPFLSHAPLEPQNCTAWYRDGTLEVWAPTQTPERAIQNAAKVLGMEAVKVTLHQTRVGGGFGRRLMNDYVCEAAAIAREVGKPVKLQWTREDDMAHDFYRPAGFHALKASLDAAGKLSGWQDHFITLTHDGEKPVPSGDIRTGELPEGLIENYKLTQSMLLSATPTGPWRAPRSNALAFAAQSFYHELAVAAGRDHLEFLLELMGEPRWLEPGNERALNTGRAAAVIRLAAASAGWARAQPPGRGLGLAFYFSHAGHFAEVADVSVDNKRKLTVHKITVVGDVGPVVNLSGAENQCHGAVMDGLSTMLGLAVTMEKGRVQQSNFHQYPLLRMRNAPLVEAHFIQSDFPPTGLGEPALPPLAPAVCNAIYAATAERIRTLPLSKSGYWV